MSADRAGQAEAHFQIALDFFAAGSNEQAVVAYNECLALNPAHSEALHGLARALQELGLFDQSVDTCRRLVQIDPADELAFTALSIALHKRGLISEAEGAANQARILGWKKQLRERKSGG